LPNAFISFVFNGAVTSYPASGLRAQTSGAFNYIGSYGYCRSIVVTGANGYVMRFYGTDVTPVFNLERAYSFSVRCVQYLLYLLKVMLFGVMYYLLG